MPKTPRAGAKTPPGSSEPFRLFTAKEVKKMARKITLKDVVPALWEGLHLAEGEETRTLSRAVFERIMRGREIIGTKAVMERMWLTLQDSGLARLSPYTNSTVTIRVVEWRDYLIRNQLDKDVDLGIWANRAYTHAYNSKSATEEGVQ